MIAFAAFAALAGDPAPCALDGLPDGKVAWTPDGQVQLFAPDGRRLQTAPTGVKFVGSVSVGCRGTSVKIVVSPPAGRGTLLRLDTYTIDFADVIASWAEYDPVELACASAKAAQVNGDFQRGVDALAPFNAADLRVARAWTALGRAAQASSLAAADPVVALASSDVAIAALPFSGFTSGEVRAIRTQHAYSLIAAGKTDEGIESLEALVALEPTATDVRLALADAQWAALDKVGSGANYLALVDLYPLDAMPPQIAVRCKPCAKALKRRAP